MVRVSIIFLMLLLPAGIASAEDDATAADATERGRSLGRILDVLLTADTGAEEGGRTLLLLVDATDSLTTADFAAELSASIARNLEALAGTRLAVMRVGDPGAPACDPTVDRIAPVKAVREILARPERTFQNLYYDVRRAAGALSSAPGSREIVLVSLENGDAEDDLEATVSALSRSGVRLSVIAPEAYLSDTYWVNSATRPPRGTTLHGGEAAFVEVPWGWLFQQGVANQFVSSGFASFGLTRLASASGGKVYLYYPPSSSGHRCAIYGSCPFCNGDHAPTSRSYQSHRLRALAPHPGPRRDAMAFAAKDPYFKAVLDIWGRAAREGILGSRPSVKRAGAGLREEKRQRGRVAALTSSLSFSSQGGRAGKLAVVAGRLAAELEQAIAHADEIGGSRRYKATADYTRMMLLITRVNLLAFEAFCREAGPVLRAGDDGSFEPPERPFYEGDPNFVGIGISSMSLCHGALPFLSLHLPGGDALKQEIAELDRHLTGYLSRNERTPFADAVYRSGIARFMLTVRGKYTPPPKRDRPDSETDDTTTERPTRGGGGGGGDTGGPASGGD
jgi:hypothetical protein